MTLKRISKGSAKRGRVGGLRMSGMWRFRCLVTQFFAFLSSSVYLIFMLWSLFSGLFMTARPEFQVLFELVLRKARNACLMFIFFLLAANHLLFFRSLARPSSLKHSPILINLMPSRLSKVPFKTSCLILNHPENLC